jgi:hypothetical protein
MSVSQQLAAALVELEAEDIAVVRPVRLVTGKRRGYGGAG